MSQQLGKLDIDLPMSSILLLTYGDGLSNEEMELLIQNIELEQLCILSDLMNSC